MRRGEEPGSAAHPVPRPDHDHHDEKYRPEGQRQDHRGRVRVGVGPPQSNEAAGDPGEKDHGACPCVAGFGIVHMIDAMEPQPGLQSVNDLPCEKYCRSAHDLLVNGYCINSIVS